MKVILFTFFLLSSLPCLADILMLDLNFSEKEVDSARKAAALRGEKLVVIPEIPVEVRKELTMLMKKKTFYHRQWLKEYDAGRQWVETDDSYQTKNRLEDLKLSYGVDAHSIHKILKSTSTKNQFSSIILSAHSEGSSYSGSMGQINFKDLNQILIDLELKDGLESAYLWGCFTGTSGAMLRWRQSFPKLNMVAGFSGRSPSGDLKNSFTLLEDLLVQEAKISKIKSDKMISQTIRDINRPYLTGLTYLKAECFVSGSRKEVSNIFNLPKDCIGKVTFLLTNKATHYVPYLNGEKPLPNSDISDTPLRDFYNKLQESYHCLDHCKSVEEKQKMKLAFENDLDAHNYDEKNLPCPGEVIRLIKMDHLVENFITSFSNEIAEYKMIMSKQENIDQQCLMLFENKSSFSTLKNNYRTCISKLSEDEISQNSVFTNLHKYLVYAVTSPTQCIPFSWIEKRTKPEPFYCL